jgi:structure-specific recognition protein 1
MYIPADPEADTADKEAETAAEVLQQKIMGTANIRKTTGDIIVSFDQSKGTFLTPRGRYAIELYDYFLRLRGQKYDYKIKYDDISRLFLLPKPDEVHMAFVIALDMPIRQGQQRYQYLVLQAPKDPDEVSVNLDEAALEKEYNGELQPVMRGALPNLIAKTFKVITKKKVFIPGKFANANQQACVKCAYRANEGLLYPLEKLFVFIHKPPILVPFNEVESVEFQRYAGGQGSTRNFDLCVTLKPDQSAKEYIFSGIDRSDYAGLYNFLSTKKIPIKNLQGSSFSLEEPAARGPIYNEDEIYGGAADDVGDEGSEDEDFDEDEAAREEADNSSDSEAGMDDDELGSEVDDDLDSDLEEAAGKKKRKTVGSDLEEDDLVSLVRSVVCFLCIHFGIHPYSSYCLTTLLQPKKKRGKKKAAAANSDDDSPKKASKKKKDPNAPKRPTSAYFYFMQENRARIKAENPGASVAEIVRSLSPCSFVLFPLFLTCSIVVYAGKALRIGMEGVGCGCEEKVRCHGCKRSAALQRRYERLYGTCFLCTKSWQA